MFAKRATTSGAKGSRSQSGSSNSSKVTVTKIPHPTINVTNIILETVDTEPIVNIPYIKTSDNARLLPKYSASLMRPKDDYVPGEDLDLLQLELENLLSATAQRQRFFKSEYESLEKDDKRRSKIVEKPPLSPGKRKRMDDKKMKPQFKSAKTKNPNSTYSPAASLHTDDSSESTNHSLPQQQQQHQLHHQHHHSQAHHLPKKEQKFMLPKNDIPNKFWLSVEPYCMPITNEDIKLLDDLLEQYQESLIPPIPDLGPHYSTLWAAQDIKEEKDISNTNPKTKTKNISHINNTDAVDLLKKGEKLMGDGVAGPLTQRLVSALMEENLMVDNFSNADSNSSSENTTSNSASTLRSLSHMKNGISIEKRMKRELIEQGILDPDDFPKVKALKLHDEDEILNEIKRVVAELTAISEFNRTELQNLKIAAKAELQRLEVKRKLDQVDQEIIETYKKVLMAKQKRRPLTSNEQEDIFRLTQEQRRLCEQLNNMPVPGPNLKD